MRVKWTGHDEDGESIKVFDVELSWKSLLERTEMQIGR
jgi:hypothetical protein